MTKTTRVAVARVSSVASTVLQEKGQGGSLPVSILALAVNEYLELEGLSSKAQFDGRLELCCGKPTIYINVRGRDLEDPRVRFTLGHELGHFFLHRRWLRRGIAFHDADVFQKDEVIQIEREANLFASECLLPEVPVRRILGSKMLSLSLVQQVASSANASIRATAIRLAHLTTCRCCFFWEEEGKIVWSAPSDDWRQGKFPFVAWKGRLPANSQAAAAGDGFAEREVPLKVWHPNAWEREAPLYESALKTTSGRLIFVVDSLGDLIG